MLASSISYFKSILREVQFIIALVISIAAFSLGVGFGFTMGFMAGGPPEAEIEVLRELAKYFHPYSPASVLLILAKNTIAVISIWLLGTLLVIPSIYALSLNGYLLGRFMSWTVIKHSMSLALALIVPHGVIEIPALILAGTAGLLWGVNASCRILRFIGLSTIPVAGLKLKEAFKIVVVSILMLIPAAIIETFITPLIAGLVI